MIKHSKDENIFLIVNSVLLILFSAITIFPLIHVFACSISGSEAVFSRQVILLPKNVTFDHFVKVFQEKSIVNGYLRTIYYTVLGTAISLSLTISSGYVLSRKDFYGRNGVMTFFIITMFINGGMIPTYMIVKELGLIDTALGFIMPGCLSVWNVIIVRTYMSSSIPNEISESAKIDGATDYTLFQDHTPPIQAHHSDHRPLQYCRLLEQLF